MGIPVGKIREFVTHRSESYIEFITYRSGSLLCAHQVLAQVPTVLDFYFVFYFQVICSVITQSTVS
jgi:hypothetical protein